MSYKGPERRTLITFTRDDADRLVRLEAQMTSTDEKLDTLIATGRSNVENLAEQIDSNSKRIGKLETRISWIIGIGTALVFVIGVLAKS